MIRREAARLVKFFDGIRSMDKMPGAMFVVDIKREHNAVAEARRHHCRIAATLPRHGTPLFAADLRAPIAILIGGEGPGLPPSLVDAAEVRITIPMEKPVESLNAAVTAALVVYEARRQRS